MAEGDTILRLARRIEAALAGRKVAVRAPHPRGRAAGVERLDGGMLLAADAHGKHLLITFALPDPAGSASPAQPELQAPQLMLHSHLGMSGGWHLYRPAERWRRPERAAWVVISSPSGPDLVQFGGPTLRLLRPEQRRRDPVLTSLGPDILAPDLDPGAAVASLRSGGEEAELGEALLDQGRISGIGNIFKSEGCFAARLDPWRRLTDLSDEDLAGVIDLTRAMMLASVEGSPRPRQVYRRAGGPCHRCGARIQSRGQGDANRTTYWCGNCQA